MKLTNFLSGGTGHDNDRRFEVSECISDREGPYILAPPRSRLAWLLPRRLTKSWGIRRRRVPKWIGCHIRRLLRLCCWSASFAGPLAGELRGVFQAKGVQDSRLCHPGASKFHLGGHLLLSGLYPPRGSRFLEKELRLQYGRQFFQSCFGTRALVREVQAGGCDGSNRPCLDGSTQDSRVCSCQWVFRPACSSANAVSGFRFCGEFGFGFCGRWSRPRRERCHDCDVSPALRLPIVATVADQMLGVGAHRR